MNIEEEVAAINEFQSRTIMAMSEDEREDWEKLSDFEKKTIVFMGWKARKIYSRIEFEKTRAALLKGLYQ